MSQAKKDAAAQRTQLGGATDTGKDLTMMLAYIHSSQAARDENFEALRDAGCDRVAFDELGRGRAGLPFLLQIIGSDDTLVVRGVRQVADDIRGLAALAERLRSLGADLLVLNGGFTAADVIRAAHLAEVFGADAPGATPPEPVAEEGSPVDTTPPKPPHAWPKRGPNPRSQEVLRRRAAGSSYKQIAADMGIAPNTAWAICNRHGPVNGGVPSVTSGGPSGTKP